MSEHKKTPKLVNLHERMSDHIDAILHLFKPGAKITVVVRSPDYGDDADVVIGSDDLDQSIAAIERLKCRQPIFKVGEPIEVINE